MPLASDTGIDLPGDAAIPNAEPPPSSYTYRWLAHLADRPLPRREVFERAITQMTFEPGEAVFDSDQDLPYLFMVLRGGIKVADPTRGNERLTGVAGVGDLVGSLPSVLPAGMPDLLSARVAESTWEPRPQWGRTNRSAIAIVDTVVERMDMRVLMSLMRRHAAWAMVGYHAMALHALGQERRARDLLTLSPQERYLNFLVQAPELIGLLPQKDIAAYIGVTPVGLSRIAARSRR